MIDRRRQAVDALNRVANPVSPLIPCYQVGDQVWLEATHLKLPHHASKLTPKRYGPFHITQMVSPIVYRLELPLAWRIHDMFHASLLSPYCKTPVHGPNYS